MIAFTKADAASVIAAARHIEHSGPAAARTSASALAVVLRLVRPDHRRTVALAILELAMRDAQTPLTPANHGRPL